MRLWRKSPPEWGHCAYERAQRAAHSIQHVWLQREGWGQQSTSTWPWSSSLQSYRKQMSTVEELHTGIFCSCHINWWVQHTDTKLLSRREGPELDDVRMSILPKSLLHWPAHPSIRYRGWNVQCPLTKAHRFEDLAHEVGPTCKKPITGGQPWGLSAQPIFYTSDFWTITPCDQLPGASATMPPLPCRVVPSWTLKPNNPSSHKWLLLGYLMIVTRWETQPLAIEMCITSVCIRVPRHPSYSKHWASESWRPVPRSGKGPQQDFCNGVLVCAALGWKGSFLPQSLSLPLCPFSSSPCFPPALSFPPPPRHLFFPASFLHTQPTVMCVCSVQTKRQSNLSEEPWHLFSGGEG